MEDIFYTKEPIKVRTTTWIDRDLYRRLQELGKKKRWSVSSTIAYLLQKHFKL